MKFAGQRDSAATRSPARERSRFGSAVRSVSESIACLIVAVVILRMFLIEGYIISTGSMAPNLLGYHKQAICPACQHKFAFGVAFDRDDFERSQVTSCPNCGQPGITLEDVPRNDGDQLLVFKNAYVFREPRRWEIVVFLNPADPTEAYVKRVAGLPGNRIQIIDGDVFIDDRREQKPIEIQRAMRIPVFDQTQPVRTASWIPRWIPDGNWKLDGQSFVLGAEKTAFETGLHDNSDETSGAGAGAGADFDSMAPTNGSMSWVHYMHWPRLPIRDRDAVIEGKVSLEPRPITDGYGYNPHETQPDQTDVNDLMLDAKISLPFLGQFVTVQRSYDELVVCVVDRSKGTVEAWVCPDTKNDFRNVMARTSAPFAIGQLPSEQLDESLHLEVSTFDRQLIVAINEQTLIARSFDDVEDSVDVLPDNKFSRDDATATIGGRIETASHTELPHGFRADVANESPSTRRSPKRSAIDVADRSSASPVRFGAIGDGATVHSVRIFRDVHYTSRDSQHAVDSPVELGSDEFFFLGDNSPVSLDSRGWRNPVVARRLIVGKPLVVHLPSRPARVHVGDWVQHVRVPDFSRMRTIR